jgi:5-methylthioadenosine/S-adenosylhomocysteine deaminase
MKTIFKNAWVVTVNDNLDVLQNAHVCVEGNSIIYVGTELPKNALVGATVYDCQGKKMVMPGFVNGHTHISQTIFRGYADDYPLQVWMQEKMSPVMSLESDESIYWGAMLGLLEMLQAGTTTINEMYVNIIPIIRALKQCGMRAIVSMGIEGNLPNSAEALAENIELFHAHDNTQDGCLHIAIGPHAEYTSPQSFFEKTAEVAAELGCRVHIHTSETKTEHEECKQRHGGKTPVAWFESMGYFRNKMLLAHCVWLEDSDLEIMKTNNASVLHCPCSNMKIASGFAPIPKMIQHGINVSLATDGAGSNNKLDMWEEMRIAALIHKGHNLNAAVLSARQTLYMATNGGAKALGLPETGSLEVGKRADLLLVNVDRPCYFPMTDIISHIVYSGSSRDIELTMVNGNILYENGVWPGMDAREICAKNQEIYEKVFKNPIV